MSGSFLSLNENRFLCQLACFRDGYAFVISCYPGVSFVRPRTEVSPQGTHGAPSTASDARHESASIKANDINVEDLPLEAQHVLQRIKIGGQFTYAKDGAVFGNREGMLPQRPHDYYHEYTVKTPGIQDRGARRIISGKTGEYYYTDDHYRSFKRIRE